MTTTTASAQCLAMIALLAAGRVTLGETGPIFLPQGEEMHIRTIPGGNYNFGFIPIPADFFGPGSDPFADWVQTTGVPINELDGTTDTILRRTADATLNGIGDTVDVPIEVIELHLQSSSPLHI